MVCAIRHPSKKEVRMASIQRGILLALFVALSQLSPLHTHPLQAQETEDQIIQKDNAPSAGMGSGMEGKATYYAKRYKGRRTSSGERYHPEKLTAASADVPLGSKVMVKNLKNGNEVLVTVNDRCRKRMAPFIDLSHAAARKLGFLGKGMARVRIFLLGDDERPRMIAQETIE
jgi:rare lipoprotein A